MRRFRRFASLFFFIICIVFVFSRIPVYATTETRWDTSNTNDSKNYPTAQTVTAGTVISGSYTNLAVSDNSYMVIDNVTGTTGNTGFTSVIFNGTFSGSIPFLQIAVEFKTNSSVTYFFQGYNFTQAGWDSFPSTMYDSSLTPTTDGTKYRYSILDGLKYVDSSGRWMFQINCTSTGVRFRVSIDLLWFRAFAYQSSSANTNSALASVQFVDGLQVGIRTWYESSTYIETELTSGISATVTGPSSTTALNGTWAAPAQTGVRRIVIRYFIGGSLASVTSSDFGAGGLPIAFETEDLNSSTTMASLTAVTWTVHYHFRYITAADLTYFYFGSNTYDSCIANFQYTLPSPGTQLNLYGLIPMTLTIEDTHSISLSRAGLITESYTIISQKSNSWNIYSTVSLNVDIESMFFSARALRLYGLIPIMINIADGQSSRFLRTSIIIENILLNSGKNTSWSIQAPINFNLNINSVFFTTRGLRIFADIIVQWAIENSRSITMNVSGVIPGLPSFTSRLEIGQVSTGPQPPRPPQFVPPNIPTGPGGAPEEKQFRMPLQGIVLIIVILGLVLGVIAEEQDRGKKRLKALRKKMEEKSPFD